MIHVVENTLLNATHNISVTLIGCGGSGSLMLSRLARLDYALRNCGKAGLDVMVFDNDIVESHNVGRQMFSIPDVGENKAVISCTKINRNFGTAYKAIDGLFDFKTKSNIFITAVDNANFRIKFDAYFKSLEIDNKKEFSAKNTFYWMDLGNAKNIGQCVLGSNTIHQGNNSDVIAKLPTIIDRFPNLLEQDTEEIQGTGCSSFAEKLNEQNLFMNDSLTAMASHLLWELFSVGYLDKAGFFMNLENLKTNPILLN
jgi:PRTRC genetic system ThiF family protein